jgi:disulfide bond formation protein DsbB
MSLMPESLDWPRIAPVAVLTVSVGGLVAALAGQYLFGLEPCILCLYQRIPYGVAALLALAALLVASARAKAWLVGGCGLAFAAGFVLAVYHVGIEQHWWGAVAACDGPSVAGLTLEDLQAQLAHNTLKPCDQLDWRLFGISLAGYNAMVMAALTAAAVLVSRALARKQQGSMQ